VKEREKGKEKGEKKEFNGDGIKKGQRNLP